MRTLLLITVLLVNIGSALAQKQGIQGQVFWLSGNQMPGPERKPASTHQGIAREIHIYNAVSTDRTKREGNFYVTIDAVLVTTVQSNADGTFKVKLPPGRYSLFTKEKEGLFANLLDGNGCINCIVVKKKKYSWITITVDYDAAF